MFNRFRLLHFTLRRDLEEIYANLFLRTFALSLVGLFVPLYLLNEIGFMFKDVLIYFIFLFGFIFVGYLLGSLLGIKIGIKKVIILSIPIELTYFLLLFGLKEYYIPLVFIGALYGLGAGFFWFAYNTYFSRFSDKKHRGEEVDVYFVLATLLGIFGPFVGGALLSYFGFNIVFLIVILLLVLSVFPLLYIKEGKYKNIFDLKKVFRKENFELSPMYFVQGARHLVTGVFWPIFIFLIVKDYFSLGIVFAIASIFSSIVIWMFGRKIDKVNKTVFANISSFFHGIISIVKIFVNSFSHIYPIAILSHITFGTTEVSMNALTFDKANKTKHIEEFFVFRELIFALGRIFVLVILLFSGFNIIGSLKLSFILLGVMSLLQKFLK